MGVRFGSFSEARPDYLGVRSVPNAASYGMLFSVSYVES